MQVNRKTLPCNVQVVFCFINTTFQSYFRYKSYKWRKWKPEVKSRKLAHLSSAPILIWVEQTMRDQIPFYIIKKLSIRGKINLVCHLAEMWKMWRQTYSQRPQLTKQPSVKKHHNQRKSKFTIFKSVKKLQDHWFAPFVRSGRIRWALLLALSLCRICKSVLRHNKAVKWMPLLFLFDQCFTPLVGFDLDRFGKDELDRGGTVVGRVLPGLLE